MYQIFLQAPAGGSAFLQMFFPAMIFIVAYFFFIRPMANKQKEQQKFAESLKEGMEVVTQSGIVGRVTKMDANTVRLMVDEKTFMRVLRSSVVAEFKA